MRTPFLISTLTILFSVAAPAQKSAAVRWFPATKGAQATKPWLPLLDTATLTLGRYRLAKGAEDGQSPHARDEVYVVVSGRAKLTVGTESRAVATGDAIFVAAGAVHRFSEIEQDLDLLVFFSKVKKATGGMAAGPRPTEQTPYPETSQRGNTRIFYWFGPRSAGQVSIDYGQPTWKAAYGKFLSQPSGRRWRFGQNFWTSLDTNIPLELAGVKVPVGAYYAVLEHTKQRGLCLVLLDPAVVRKRRLDAYEAPKTKGGISIPLRLAENSRRATQLSLDLSVDRTKRDEGALTIRFGPHELTASLKMRPAR